MRHKKPGDLPQIIYLGRRQAVDETSFSLSLFYFSIALNKIGKNVSMANLTNSGLDSPSPPSFC